MDKIKKLRIGSIDYRVKRLPRECYKSWIHYVLGIVSPSKQMIWEGKRLAEYFETDDFQVWLVDTKTNGEKWGN